MTSQPDSKDIPRKEEFQKYLEKAGVIDQLTKLLVSLYENPDRPENALVYIKSFLGADVPSNDDSQQLHNRIEELEQQSRKKDLEIAQLKEQLQSNQKPNGSAPENEN